MSNDDTTECHVVTYGEGSCVKGVHGVFMDERRAEIATEELARVYDDTREWVDMDTHELVTEPGYMAGDGE